MGHRLWIPREGGAWITDGGGLDYRILVDYGTLGRAGHGLRTLGRATPSPSRLRTLGRATHRLRTLERAGHRLHILGRVGHTLRIPREGGA